MSSYLGQWLIRCLLMVRRESVNQLRENNTLKGPCSSCIPNCLCSYMSLTFLKQNPELYCVAQGKAVYRLDVTLVTPCA